MKRGGGRRFYRPDDLDLLRGIRYLLHREGYTIKGVQKILREQGPEHVKACWQAGTGGTGGNPSAAPLEPDEDTGATAGRGGGRSAGATGSARSGKTGRSADKSPLPVDLAAQLDTIVEALEAAQSILRGKPMPRRTRGGRPLSAVAQTGGKPTAAASGSLQSKKARGR
jgi:DNA-binding transcriptional MerR regulator